MVATYQPAVSAASNQNSANSVETIDEKQKRKLCRTIYGDFEMEASKSLTDLVTIFFDITGKYDICPPFY